jgi:tetratricopeptide (TPR) repeat protein
MQNAVIVSSSSIREMRMKHSLYAYFLCIGTLIGADTFQEQFDRANQLFIAHDYDGAISAYTDLIATWSHIPQVSFNLATAYFKTRKLDEALRFYRHTLQLDPTHCKALCQLGKIYASKSKFDAARAMYRRALLYAPGYPPATLPLAQLYNEQEEFVQAAELLQNALERTPDYPPFLFALANTLMMLNRYEDAHTLFARLLEKLPNHPDALYGVAYTLKYLGDVHAALPFYRRIFDMEPNHADAQLSYALALLSIGNEHPRNWQEGWKYYETRWKSEQQQPQRKYTQPLWDGSDPHGKTVFLCAEQGLGDSIQFIRFAKLLHDRGARIILAAQNPLRTLMTLCPYIDQVIGMNDTPAFFDYHAPLLSLPYLLKTPLDAIAHEIPYVYADADLEARWRLKLAANKTFKIGICWQGNSSYASPFLRMTVSRKSISLKQLYPLMEIPGVSVYSLQKMSGTDQLRDVPSHLTLHTFDDDFDVTAGRFMDTAAVIKQLDLVITVDTSICHLAGALGVPVWTILPEPADWRWMLHCDDTPWYPNMRLFRQHARGDWQTVIDEVITQLHAYLAGYKPLIYHQHSYKKAMHT